MLSVTCRGCGQELRLGRDKGKDVVPELIYWMQDCNELCPACKKSLQECVGYATVPSGASEGEVEETQGGVR